MLNVYVAIIYIYIYSIGLYVGWAYFGLKGVLCPCGQLTTTKTVPVIRVSGNI